MIEVSTGFAFTLKYVCDFKAKNYFLTCTQSKHPSVPEYPICLTSLLISFVLQEDLYKSCVITIFTVQLTVDLQCVLILQGGV